MDGVVDRAQAFPEQEVDPGVSLVVNEITPRRIAEEISPPTCEDVVSGTVVSDFVFQNPGEIRRNVDLLVFPGPIVGIIHQRDCMLSSDMWGQPGVTYPSEGGLELSGERDDALELLPSRRSLFHKMTASAPGDWDGYRVISELPNPETIADVRLGCTASYEGGIVSQGETHEVTLTLHDDGSSDAPDAQIAFRHHVTMTVTDIQGPFVCDPIDEFRGYVCTLDDGVLPVGASPELRVSVLFERAPSRTSRVLAFGSGAVNDSDLTNNDCDLVALGPEPVDGSTPEDGAVLADGDVVSGHPQTTFRGAGGCECDASGGRRPGRHLLFPLSVVLVLWWSRRRR
jgi:hypothetical protein